MKKGEKLKTVINCVVWELEFHINGEFAAKINEITEREMVSYQSIDSSKNEHIRP